MRRYGRTAKRCCIELDCGRSEEVWKAFGKSYELNERATFVGEARKDVMLYGHMTQAPSVTQVKTFGTSAGRKRRVGLTDADGGSTQVASLEFEDTRMVASCDRPRLTTNTKNLVGGMFAALCVDVLSTAYGGRDPGWHTPPGSLTQKRFAATASAFDAWMWEVGATWDPPRLREDTMSYVPLDRT